MDRRRMGFFLVAIGLLVFVGVLPFLPAVGAVTDGAHFIMGLSLGVGVVMVFAAAVSRGRGLRHRRG